MEVGVEEDVFSATGMNLPIEDLTVEDILLEGEPEELVREKKKVLGSRMGKILLRELKNRYPNGPFIRFHLFGKIDEDGEIVDEAGEMRYYGCLLYTSARAVSTCQRKYSMPLVMIAGLS